MDRLSELQGDQGPLESLPYLLSNLIQVRIICHTNQLSRINGARNDIAIVNFVHDDVARKQYTEFEFFCEPLVG